MADVAKYPLSNIAQRVITAVVVAPIIIATVLLGGLPFMIVVTFFSVVGLTEFFILARNRPSQGRALVGIPTLIVLALAFYLNDARLGIGALALCMVVTFVLEIIRHRTEFRRSVFQVGMTLAGVLYLGLPTGCLIALRALPDGALWILLILCITWGTDTFAYIGGRLWGKTKLAPRLSPKKTREGAVVGVLGGIIPSLILLAVTQHLAAGTLVLVFAGPFVAILGDLLESGLKRFFQVKDSHIAGLDILPGHGGILDRVDSLLLVTAFAYLCFLLLGIE
ncbi:MAG: phosphatidate cytidylyltransferase [Anaerolineae bacterium]|nr:phosphatidate cytidylyltransferase [Anaerolineae bacterium]